ncbi:MAG: shikimate kinase [Idiomarina sp.]|nr:shikimate kinase [Idiomarina sp.]
MKVTLLGNAGAGKSSFARLLSNRNPVAYLSLDEVAFCNGAQRRELQESVADVEAFIAQHDSWIIEGCYADILEPVLTHCDMLFFLNPGVEVCIAHCLERPWEPEKFASKAEQDQHLESLIAWVRDYETRTDEYGLQRHRALFDGFSGNKREFTHSSEYSSVSTVR